MKSSHTAVVAVVAILAVVAIVAITHQGQAQEPETATMKVGRVANGMVRTGIETAITAAIPALIHGLRLSGIAG